MNKKGFTLIELLAVIVILAIILLIAMPIVLNVINESRKGAFNSTGYGLVKTAENDYMRRALDGETVQVTYSFIGGTQQAPNPGTIDELDFTGQGPSDGSIVVTNDGNIYMAITDGTYCTVKEIDATDVKTYDTDELIDAYNAEVTATIESMTNCNIADLELAPSP